MRLLCNVGEQQGLSSLRLAACADMPLEPKKAAPRQMGVWWQRLNCAGGGYAVVIGGYAWWLSEWRWCPGTCDVHARAVAAQLAGVLHYWASTCSHPT